MAGSVLCGLVSLLALGQATTAQDIILEDTHFYGQSPPVYPSPNGTGIGEWAEAYTKAKALVEQMTLEEKVSLVVLDIVNNSSQHPPPQTNPQAVPEADIPTL